jgi:chromosomal replication initiator protein
VDDIKNPLFSIVCEYYRIQPKDLIGKCRKPNCVIPRHMIQYLMKYELNMNYTQIGKVLNRKYNSVMHGINCIEIQLTNRIDPTIKNDLFKLKEKLK